MIYRYTIYMPKMSDIKKLWLFLITESWRNCATRFGDSFTSANRPAQQMGLEPQPHQLMLALKGLPLGIRLTIGTLAERLQLQHHSTTRKIVKSNWSWTATVSRSGTSNSTLKTENIDIPVAGSNPVADWNVMCSNLTAISGSFSGETPLILRNGSPLRPAQTGFRMAPEYSENGQFGSFAGGGVLEMMLFCAAVISGRSACTETPSVPPEKPSM
jgi:hypothetical protein